MNGQLLATVVISALTGATIALMTERWMDHPQPTLATIDPTVLVAEQLRNLEPGLDDTAIEQRGQAYAQRLDSTITAIAKERNVMILVKPAVITGVPDLTEDVRRRLNGIR